MNLIQKLEDLKKVHILGVCGTLMGSFASLLKRRGIEVSGSDFNSYPPMSDVLKNAGIELFEGYSADNINKLKTHSQSVPDVVIVGNVITKHNPEAIAVQEAGLNMVSLPEFMEKYLLSKTINCIVSGTHGKTSTSSLMAHVLSQAGERPSYFIGGVCYDLPNSFHLDKGKHFVLEGDEYDTVFWDKVPKFNYYLPDHVILTSVEFDHADIYDDLSAVMKAFEGLLNRIRKGGHLIACVDYQGVKELIKRYVAKTVKLTTYGMNQEADFQPASIKMLNGFTVFQVKNKSGEFLEEIKIRHSGTYNVLNALAVWIEGQRLGLDASKVVKALENFRGVKRRQEIRAESCGTTVIDDFAHHPTAVRETLEGLKFKYSGRKLIAVFEPRSATSRRKVFQEAYAKSFECADLVFIAEPYDQSKISESDRFSSHQLTIDLSKAGIRAKSFETTKEGVDLVLTACTSNEVVVVLSNGGFNGFIDSLIKKLSSPIKVLIVDDDDQNRILIRSALEKFSELEIVEANSGNSAFEIMNTQENFDLLITDLRMSDGTGIELLRRLKKKGKPPKHIIVVTGIIEGGEAYLKILGVNHSFEKPFDILQFQEVVQKLLVRS